MEVKPTGAEGAARFLAGKWGLARSTRRACPLLPRAASRQRPDLLAVEAVARAFQQFHAARRLSKFMASCRSMPSNLLVTTRSAHLLSWPSESYGTSQPLSEQVEASFALAVRLVVAGGPANRSTPAGGDGATRQ